MKPEVENMRELLEAGDIGGFLATYGKYRQQHTSEPALTGLTQRVLPPVLRDGFKHERVSAGAVVLLWRMVRDGRLLIVENDLLLAINLRIDQALKLVDPAAKLPAAALVTFDDVERSDERPRVERAPPAPGATPALQVKRVAVVSAFSVSTWSAVDGFDFRKNLCASQQEREFLQAVRQYFPSLQAYPNLPLRNFIDIDKLEGSVPVRARNYAWSAQVDVLLCTADEDPVFGIELDSIHHDTEEAAERDELKNLLFNLAGLPLVRIRADEPKAVRAEDFYDLLVSQAKTLDDLRPRRLRPRRTHDFLVPAEAYSRTR
jgi:hypothetical protein